MTEESGMEIWAYVGSTDERYEDTRRLGFWIARSGARRVYSWMAHCGIYSNPDDPLNDLKQNLKMCSTYYPIKWTDKFLSTIQFEGLREAIDDMRYLATAERAIAGKKASSNPKDRDLAAKLEKDLDGLLGKIDGHGKRTYPQCQAVRQGLVDIIRTCR